MEEESEKPNPDDPPFTVSWGQTRILGSRCTETVLFDTVMVWL